jgi:hypothetical protein
VAQPLDDFVEQISYPFAMLRRDLRHGIEAKLIELDGSFRTAVIRLVDGEERRLVGGADGIRDLAIAGEQTLAAIDDEHQQIGGLNRAAAALEDKLVEWILADAEHSAGVHDLERHAAPFRLLRNHIARRARNGRDDRAALAGDAIE